MDEQTHSAIGELIDTAFDDTSRAQMCGHIISGLQILPAGATLLVTARPEIPALQTHVTPGQRRLGDDIDPHLTTRLPLSINLSSAESLDEARVIYTKQVELITAWVRAADRVLTDWSHALMAGMPGCDDVEFIDTARGRCASRGVELLPVCAVVPDLALEMHAELDQGADDHLPVRIRLSQANFEMTISDTPAHEGVAIFLDAAAEHARRERMQITAREKTIAWFLELHDPDQ